jgi:hypothetical protein
VCDDPEFGETVRREILRVFGVKPRDIGLEPLPRRVRVWRAVTLARWRYRVLGYVIDRVPGKTREPAR